MTQGAECLMARYEHLSMIFLLHGEPGVMAHTCELSDVVWRQADPGGLLATWLR